MKRLAVLIAGVVLVGCGRTPDYLFYAPVQAPPTSATFEHRIKDIQGDTAADLLWVIDNSRSMGPYQKLVIQNTELFMREFTKQSALDWKMGLISTDTADDPFIGFTAATALAKGTPDPVVQFQEAVYKLGTYGSGYEKTFQPVMTALERHPSFLRPDAKLVLITVTDAVEGSTIDAKSFLKSLAKTKGDLTRVLFYGVFGAQDLGCASQAKEDPWVYEGSKYETAVVGTKGKSYVLCREDFGKNLIELGQDITKRFQYPKLALSSRPNPKTIRVSYRGKDLPGGPFESGGFWYYDFDFNSLLFYNLDFAPGETETVQVTYTPSGT